MINVAGILLKIRKMCKNLCYDHDKLEKKSFKKFLCDRDFVVYCFKKDYEPKILRQLTLPSYEIILQKSSLSAVSIQICKLLFEK